MVYVHIPVYLAEKVLKKQFNVDGMRRYTYSRKVKKESMMFRNIRKKKNEINIEEAKDLLKESRRGVLAVNGDEGYPYAIPVNYLYEESENKIIFHGAKAGHKVDSIKKNDKVCFTVYGNERIKEEEWAPFMQSVVVFGRCRLINDLEENIRLVKLFAKKYYPNQALVEEEASMAGRAVQMFEICIEHLSGKEVQER